MSDKGFHDEDDMTCFVESGATAAVTILSLLVGLRHEPKHNMHHVTFSLLMYTDSMNCNKR